MYDTEYAARHFAFHRYGAASERAHPFWTLRYGFLVFVLPQLPTLLWWTQTHSWVHLRGWINLEYLVLLGVAILLPNWGTFLLVTAEMCVALVEPFAHLYYFHPGDILPSLRYLALLPVPRLLAYTVLLLAYGCGTSLVLKALVRPESPRRMVQVLGLMLAVGLGGIAADVARGRFAPLGARPAADVREMRIVRAPALSVFWVFYAARLWDAKHPSSPLPLPSALSQAMARLPAGSRPNVVLVLTESWGLANDGRLTEAQMQPYRSSAVNDIYRVQTGTVGFDGSTTSGETRELCGNSLGLGSLPGPDSYFAACWPARLDGQGYTTLGVHGFSPNMFRRAFWYRRFRFQQEYFQPDLERAGAATCDGAFVGICDADVAAWIGRRLVERRGQGPLFVHWVTLNSHLPIPTLSAGVSRSDCAAAGIASQESLCGWFLLIHRLHESVARLAATPGLPPTVFVIVGDHAPPFVNAEVHNRFSQKEVPYIVLTPRAIEQQQVAGPPAAAPAQPAKGVASVAQSPSRERPGFRSRRSRGRVNSGSNRRETISAASWPEMGFFGRFSPVDRGRTPTRGECRPRDWSNGTSRGCAGG
jgi:hypothetical protein